MGWIVPHHAKSCVAAVAALSHLQAQATEAQKAVLQQAKQQAQHRWQCHAAVLVAVQCHAAALAGGTAPDFLWQLVAAVWRHHPRVTWFVAPAEQRWSLGPVPPVD
jgi:hypothetical protein